MDRVLSPLARGPRPARRAASSVGGVGTVAIGAFVGLIGLAIPSIAPARECRDDCVPAPLASQVVDVSPLPSLHLPAR